MTGTGGAKADYLSAGRALEQNRDWSGAIDAYLKVWHTELSIKWVHYNSFGHP